MAGRIDVYQHILPHSYIAALERWSIGMGGLAPPAWSEGLALAAMDRCEIETGIVSISVPDVHFGEDAAARHLSREVNEFAAGLAERRAGRFGFEGSLNELGYAMPRRHPARQWTIGCPVAASCRIRSSANVHAARVVRHLARATATPGQPPSSAASAGGSV
jgi:hypothetical protein